MALVLSNLKDTFFKLGPLILLVFICISEFHTQFYYWILRDPDILGYGFVFICGFINDVVLSLPLGTSALSYLFVSLVAAYVRTATVRNSLFTDWFTFVVAIIIGNFIYFFLLNKFADADIKYTTLFYNSLFTFILYPFFWGLFEIYKKITFSRRND